jgi:hypothetical protein
MARFEPEELGFIDEVSKDERMIGRRFGRSKRGTRACKSQPFVRGRRTSTVGVLTVDGFVSGSVVEGSLTKVALLHWLEFSVVCPPPFFSLLVTLTTAFQMPLCSPYPGPLSVLVLDNARIHHNDEILALADRFGVLIEYLPPYSPDLNPIEEAFSLIKHFLRRHKDYYGRTQGDGIMYDMYEVLDIVTADDAKGFIAHAGYF